MTTRDPAYDRARKRAKELREFYTHFAVYIAVCTLLVIIDVVGNDAGSTTEFIGLDWAYWPIFGWGAAVAIHGARTFIGVGDWEERKAQELYDEERKREPLHR